MLHRLYHDLAFLWPLMSPPEDYAKEASYWRGILRQKLGPGDHDILELGVGGGHNLSHLTGEFRATGVDLSEKMLEHCRKLNPEVELHVGDMRTVRLGRRFRAVLIHDAISYLLSDEDLRQTFATAAIHLEPGGVLVIAPDHYRETFHSPSVEYSVHSAGDFELTYIEYQNDLEPHDTVIETVMFFLIRTGDKLRVEQDRHLQGLFPLTTWLELMTEAGFLVEKHPYPVHADGRDAYLLVGTKRSNR